MTKSFIWAVQMYVTNRRFQVGHMKELSSWLEWSDLSMKTVNFH